MAWLGRSVGTARLPSGAAERPALHGANHPSALPVASSGSSGGTGAGWMTPAASHPRAALPRPELTCSHRSLAGAVDVSGLGLGVYGCFAAALRMKQVGVHQLTAQPALAQSHRLALRRPA
jgi:hypothetical protein